MNNTLFYPPSVDWEMTADCNHSCIHCYNYWRTATSGSNLKRDEKFYISCAEKLVAAKPVSVQITGGEPLLVWTKIRSAIQILLDAGINVSINTNATLVTDEIAEFLANYRMDAFVSFPCSKAEVFDRIVHTTGAFDRAERGIFILLRHGVRVSPNMVVTKINLPYVYETGKYVHEKFRVPYFSATKASFPQNADPSFRNQLLDISEFNRMLKDLIRIKEDFGMRVDSAWVYSLCGFADEQLMSEFGFNRKCACGRYAFVLDSEANIKACGCDSTVYGSLLSDSFAETISCMGTWQDASMLAPECKTCSALKYCGGGCRADALSSAGCSSMLDSTADVRNRNRQISSQSALFHFDDDFVFTANPKAVFTQENGFTRISYRTNFDYITNEFATLLSSGPISIKLLKRTAEVCDKELHYTVGKLLHKGLLIQSSLATVNSDFPQKSIAILASPYISENESQLVRDYAGSENNTKRFS